MSNPDIEDCRQIVAAGVKTLEGEQKLFNSNDDLQLVNYVEVESPRIVSVQMVLMILGAYCIGSITWVILNIVLAVIPFAMVYIGSTNLTNCPFNIFIPIFLLVAGIFGTTIQFCKIYFYFKHRKNNQLNIDDDRNRKTKIQICLDVMLGIWCIFGAWWIFRMERPSFLSTDSDYCDQELYKFTLLSIKIGIIFLIIFPCFTIICILLYIKMKSIREAQTSSYNTV